MIGDGEGLDEVAGAVGESRSRGSVALNVERSLGGTAIGPDAARRFLAGLVFLKPWAYADRDVSRDSDRWRCRER
ncbi:hypothetical protein JG687_00019731 [Phytophthora cactorum]|uniref:Uncharacterized protein n=1 Tax=Phytophthora cactorum TaxID=29920 RepID=A0A8T1TIM8_9STRA|nr:hypothetical protein JG687_00019731 [Phytophthora cactorum]